MHPRVAKYIGLSSGHALFTQRHAVVLFVYLCLFGACKLSTEDEKPHDAYFDEMLHRADLLVDSGRGEQALVLVDSAYAALPEAVTSDLFRVLNFKRDYFLNDKKDHEQAMRYSDSMLKLIESRGADRYQATYASAHFLKGDVFFDQRDYDQAYEYYYRGKVIAEDIVDSCALSEYSYRLGMVCYKQSKYAESAVYFAQAFAESGSCRQSMWSYAFRQEQLGNIGLSYAHMNMPDSAVKYYDQALAFINDHRFVSPHDSFYAQTAKGVLYGNLADVYLKKGDTLKAEHSLRQSVAINMQKGRDNRDARYAQIKLATVFIHRGRLAEAKALLDSVRAEHLRDPDEEALTQWHKVSSEYFAKQGQMNEAYRHLMEFMRLKEARTRVNRNFVTADADMEFKNIERKHELDVLRRESNLKNAYLLIAAVFSVMALVILLLIWVNSRGSKKNIQALKNLNEQVNIKNQTLAFALSELEQSNKDKDRIMQVLAHDLRNPLAAVSGISMLMLDAPYHNETDRELLQMIKTSSDTSANMITDILEVTLGIQAENLKKSDVDIHLLVHQCVSLLQFKAEDKQQRIEMESDGPKTIFASSEKIWRVINNLIVNAIKFSPPSTLIKVCLKHTAEGVHIEVEDNGIGIPEEMRSKVFDTFTAAKRYGTSGEQPFGLGLSISRQIVEAHKGKIGFRSKPEGGTVFYVDLPASA